MIAKQILIACAVLAGLLTICWLGKVIRDFDRKMVAAGERRRIAAVARAADHAAPSDN